MTLWIIGILSVLAGCAAQAPIPPPGSTRSPSPSVGQTARPATEVLGSSTLDCGASIGRDVPTAGFTVVADAMALPTAPKHEALQTARTGDGNPAVRLFAKTGLGIRAGVASELITVTSAVAVGWGNPSSPTTRMVIPACGDDAGGSGWLWYAGGYWVARPTCALLTVRSGGAQQTVNLGLGTPCPGQLPPQGASDS